MIHSYSSTSLWTWASPLQTVHFPSTTKRHKGPPKMASFCHNFLAASSLIRSMPIALTILIHSSSLNLMCSSLLHSTLPNLPHSSCLNLSLHHHPKYPHFDRHQLAKSLLTLKCKVWKIKMAQAKQYNYQALLTTCSMIETPFEQWTPREPSPKYSGWRLNVPTRYCSFSYKSLKRWFLYTHMKFCTLAYILCTQGFRWGRSALRK